MYAIVGLGNPGAEYEGTRHNVGADALRYIAAEAAGPVAPSWQSKFSCNFAREKFAGESCIFVLPQKYMNLSGEAVAPLLSYFKIPAENVIVLYDELDFSPGVLKLKLGGSAAGHNGIKDLIRHLDGDFYRVRIGIGHPRQLIVRNVELNSDNSAASTSAKPENTIKKNHKVDVSSWVLSRPGPEDKELIQKAVSLSGKVVKVLIEDGIKAAQNRFHLK